MALYFKKPTALIYAQKYILNFDILNRLDIPLTITTDLDFYCNANWDLKIAVVECSYYETLVPNKKTLERIVPISNAVVFKSVEGYGGVFRLMHEFDYPNLKYFIGYVPNDEPKQASWTFDSYWIGNTASIYTDGLDNFRTDARYIAGGEKPYMFDVLYGQPKAHRTFTRDYLGDDPRFLQSPYLKSSSVHSDAIGDRNSIFWEDDIEIRRDHKVDFMGQTMLLSQTMPFKVYNSCHYSLVHETWTDNEYSFYTEKVAKPMVAGRLFIPISGQYFLKNLRRIGFGTFHGIIDESFDNIPNHSERWAAALEEAKKLCERDPDEVKALAQPIIDHNRKRLLHFKHNFFGLEDFVVDLILRPSDEQG